VQPKLIKRNQTALFHFQREPIAIMAESKGSVGKRSRGLFPLRVLIGRKKIRPSFNCDVYCRASAARESAALVIFVFDPGVEIYGSDLANNGGIMVKILAEDAEK
jgi:hypothetical protein